MGEGGPNAPSVSEVAKRLAEQRFSRVGAVRQPAPSLNVSRRRLSLTKGRSLRRSCASPSLPSLTSWAEEDNRRRQELTRVEARALERHLPRTTPLPTLLLLRTWRSTWKKLTGRPSASVGNASVDEVVREPRVAPTSSRQPLLQSRDVLPEPHVVTDGLPPTEQGLHAGTNPLYKPPGAVRLGGTPDGSLNVLWITVRDVSIRHPPLIVAPAPTTLSV
jgi:hypothetical protein